MLTIVRISLVGENLIGRRSKISAPWNWIGVKILCLSSLPQWKDQCWRKVNKLNLQISSRKIKKIIQKFGVKGFWGVLEDFYKQSNNCIRLIARHISRIRGKKAGVIRGMINSGKNMGRIFKRLRKTIEIIIQLVFIHLSNL